MNYFLATFGFAVFFSILKILHDGTLSAGSVMIGDSIAGGVGLSVAVTMLGWVLGRAWTKNRFKAFFIWSSFLSILMVYGMLSGQMLI
jgi:hypothetical protein